MAKTEPPRLLSPLSLAVLMTVARGPLHGYAIMMALEERSGPRLVAGAGSLYAALERMAKDGLLLIEDDPGDPRRKRRFRITARGRAAARAELGRMAELVAEGRSHHLMPERA